MEKIVNTSYMINAAVFSIMGMAILGIGFWIFDKLTPYSLWKEVVEEKNLAVAIIVGAITLGVSLIIASAIHG